MSPRRPAIKTTTPDCASVVRRISGPAADELFFLCRPEGGEGNPVVQAEAAYGAMCELLRRHGAPQDAVVSETLFLRDLAGDRDSILDARRQLLGEAERRPGRAVTTVVGQAPLCDACSLELTGVAIVPRQRRLPSTSEIWSAAPNSSTANFERIRAKLIRVGEQTQVHAVNIVGCGASAFEEAYDMFRRADDLLRQAGIGFRQVVRTWIYLADIDRDYEEFNRARREFFASRGVEIMPASTGVGGIPAVEGRNFSLSLYAINSPQPLDVRLMSTDTLNEAWSYGSDFSRGLRVAEADKTALYVSGTASIDEAGRTVHVGDLRRQVDRMLVNISTLLEAQGASFADVLSGVTYLKHRSDAPLLRAMFEERGFQGFPCALVEAPLCRPDLLCETEAVAALPLPQQTR